MVQRHGQSIFKIPYFRALAIWNGTQSPMSGIAWVIPYGPKKVPPDGSDGYLEVNEIRKNPPGSSSSSQSQPSSSPPPLPPPPPPPPVSSSSSTVPVKLPSPKTPEASSGKSDSIPEYKNFYIYPSELPSYDISKDVEIKPSTIPRAGEGVFTLTSLKAKQPIGIYQGRVIISDEEVKKSKSKYIMEIRLTGKNSFEGMKHFWVDGSEEEGGNWTGKVNHSKKNNVEFLQTGKFVTKRNIKPGEELFVDYGPDAEFFLRSSSKSDSESSKRKESPSFENSGEHMLYNRAEHIRYVRSGTSKGKEYKYIYNLVHDEGQMKAPVPLNQRVKFKYAPNIMPLELGAGAYGNVYVGELQGKKVAAKFQILDAPIPKSDCVMQSEAKECRSMTEGQFKKELQYMSWAHEALGNIAPKILGVEYWSVKNVEVEPSISPNERLKLPSKIVSVTTPFIQGTDLFNIREVIKKAGLEESVTETIMLAMKLLYDFQYDPNNEDKHLVWQDLHFGNIMETSPGDVIKFVDMGMLRETKESWPEVEKFYRKRLKEEWES